MKNVFKSCISLLLSVILAIGMITPVMAENENKKIDKNDVEVSGKANIEIQTLADDSNDPGAAQDVYYWLRNPMGSTYVLYLASEDYVTTSAGTNAGEYQKLDSNETVPWKNTIEEGYTISYIYIEDDIYPVSTEYWFYCFDEDGTSTISGLDYLHTTYTTNMERMFQSCGLTKFIDFIQSMDVSKCENMHGIFHNGNTNSLSSTTLDLSNWEINNVVDMTYMFYSLDDLEEIILPNNEFTPSSTKDMFDSCKALVSIKNLDKINMAENTDMSSMFAYCNALEEIDISSWEFDETANTKNMFYNDSLLAKIVAKLPSIGFIEFPATDDNYWYTEDGKAYLYNEIPAFETATTFYSENPLWIADEAQTVYYFWNGTDLFLTSNETEAGTNASGELSLGNTTPWNSTTLNGNNLEDITSVTILNINFDNGIWPSSAAYLFAGFTNASFEGLEYLHTDYTTNMSHMFQDCDNLTDNDARCIEGFNTERCTNMSYMFDDAAGYIYFDTGYKSYTAISSLDLSGWDMSKVTNISSMFSNMYGAYNSADSRPMYGITEITLPSGNFAPSPTSMAELFSGDAALETITNIEQINTSEATSMKEVFYRCLKLNGDIDLSTWDVSSVKSMEGMFYECEALTAIDTSTWDTGKNESFKSSFYGCSSLESIYTSNWNTSSVTDMESMFHYCEVLPNIETSGWNTANVTTIKNMFEYCYCLETVDVTNWNTSKVTDMSGVFRDCYKLHDIDVSGWDTANVINMTYMFDDCSSLTGTMDLSGWDTSKVGSTSTTGNRYGMSSMFQGCENLKILDLSGWDTSNVWAMNRMFQGCTSLTTIYAAENQFALNSNVTADSNHYGQNMFDGCKILVGGNETECDGKTNTDCTMAHVDVAGNPGYFTLCEHDYTKEITDYTCTDKTDLDSYVFYGSLICMKCNNEIPFTSEDSNVTVTHNGNIDCTGISQITFTINVNYNDEVYTATDEINIEAEGHKFSGDGYWTLINGQSDNASCVAYYICDVCGEEIPVEDISVSRESSTAPTCTADGENVFKATGTLDNGIGESITVEHTLTETLSQLGHEWDEITFIWNEDYNNASAFRTCTRCGDTESASRVSISHRTTNPTCTEAGSIVYTATATFSDGTSATDSKTVELSATGHTWTFNQDDPDSYIINLSGGWMQFILTCSACGETYTTTRVNLTFETYDTYEGQTGITYCTAKITIGDKEYEFKKNINEVSAQAEQVMNAHAWYEYSTKACTCTTNGVVTYKCSDCGATKDVIETAKGHDWDEDNAQWNWSSNYSKCTVTAKCLVCGHSDTESCTVTTATSGNNTMYTAVATMDDGQTLRTTTTANASAQATHSGNNSVSSSSSGNNGNAVNSDEGTATSVSSTAADDTARDTAASETASDSTASDTASSGSGQEATADSTSGAKTGEIIAFSVVGAIVIAAIIVLIVTLVSRRRKATANGADDFDEDDEDDDEDDNE